jgi:hypothetical protein
MAVENIHTDFQKPVMMRNRKSSNHDGEEKIPRAACLELFNQNRDFVSSVACPGDPGQQDHRHL